MEELFGEVDARAASMLGAPAATGPSAFVVTALRGPRADPGSSSGGGLGTDPTPDVGLDAWLEGMDRIASFPATCNTPGVN